VFSRMSSEGQGLPEAKTRVAVAQMCSSNDREANLASCSRLCEEAVNQRASLLCLPECFSFIGTHSTEASGVVEPVDGSGEWLSRYQELARSHNIWLSLGGYQETGPDAERRYNTHVLMNSSGEIVETYRKVHLYDVEYPAGGISMRESATVAPGSELKSAATPFGTLGLMVCYDMRFPAISEALRFSRGASVLLYPSAFMPATGKAHWEVLLRARAIETQCYVLAAAQCGRHSDKRASYGHAIGVDPWGEVVASCADPDTEGIAVLEIDPDKLRDVRGRMPLAEQRRPHLFQQE